MSIEHDLGERVNLVALATPFSSPMFVFLVHCC